LTGLLFLLLRTSSLGRAIVAVRMDRDAASLMGIRVERIYAVSELPEDVRRSLPALPIGGAMYSKNAADRMLIVGGQILHEGDTIAPELKLEQIRLKSAVFRYKSYRYEVSY